MPDMILIHGAWAGAWVWETALPELEVRGIRPRAVDLPGNGHQPAPTEGVSLSTYTAHVLDVMAEFPGPVVLAAHSGGGAVATQVAEIAPERVAGIAYVAGMMLPPGTAFGDLVTALLTDHPEAAGIGPHLTWSEDGESSTVPPAAAREIFFHDAPATTATVAARRLTAQPESGRSLRPEWTPERFGTVPRLYLEALHDRSVVLAAQRRMQTLVPGAEVASLPTGHAPQLADPTTLAAHLADFAHRVSPAAGVMNADATAG